MTPAFPPRNDNENLGISLFSNGARSRFVRRTIKRACRRNERRCWKNEDRRNARS